MKYKVLFTAYHNVRKTPIQSGYHPDWISNDKPKYNCAKLSFEDKESIFPGEQYQCILEPLMPELWEAIITNDILRCMEGPKQVGEARIIEIIL